MVDICLICYEAIHAPAHNEFTETLSPCCRKPVCSTCLGGWLPPCPNCWSNDAIDAGVSIDTDTLILPPYQPDYLKDELLNRLQTIQTYYDQLPAWSLVFPTDAETKAFITYTTDLLNLYTNFNTALDELDHPKGTGLSYQSSIVTYINRLLTKSMPTCPLGVLATFKLQHGKSIIIDANGILNGLNPLDNPLTTFTYYDINLVSYQLVIPSSIKLQEDSIVRIKGDAVCILLTSGVVHYRESIII